MDRVFYCIAVASSTLAFEACPNPFQPSQLNSPSNHMSQVGMLLDMSNNMHHYSISLLTAWSKLRLVWVRLVLLAGLALYDAITDKRPVILFTDSPAHPVCHATGASECGQW